VTAVVYTALMGGYETLREEPLAHESGADFVCFTDDRHLTSRTWQVVRVAPWLATDPVRSSRRLKICGHPELERYDQSLWIDNTVELLSRPEDFVDDWLDGVDLAAPLHSGQASVLTEAEAILDLGKDDAVRVYEQIAHYSRHAHAVLGANPHWTGMLARRRTPEVAAAMQTWWEHVLRFSRRDQLSFSVVMAECDVRLRSLSLPNLESPLHRWPRSEGRVVRRSDDLRDALRPPIVQIAALEQERERLTLETASRDVLVEELTAERVWLVAESDKLQRDAQVADIRIRELENDLTEVRTRARRLRRRLRRQRARRQELERPAQKRTIRRWWRAL
jgi:hypothetical protein